MKLPWAPEAHTHLWLITKTLTARGGGFPGLAARGLPAWPFRPWTVDGHRVQGVDGVDRALAAASHPCASRAFKGKLPEELKDKLQQQLLPPRDGRQGLLLRAPLGPRRPAPLSSWASTGCRLRMGNEPQKGRRKIHRKPTPCTSGSGILDAAGRRRGLK